MFSFIENIYNSNDRTIYSTHDINQYIDKYIGHHYIKLVDIINHIKDLINISNNLKDILKTAVLADKITLHIIAKNLD